MQIDLDKINKLPPDVRDRFQKLLIKYKEEDKKELAQNDFLAFTKTIWPEFIEGEHHKTIADKFNKLASGEIKRLIVNMPPRHTKSEFASTLLPAWMIGTSMPNRAHTRLLAFMESKVRALSPGFKRRFKHRTVVRNKPWIPHNGSVFFQAGLGHSLPMALLPTQCVRQMLCPCVQVQGQIPPQVALRQASPRGLVTEQHGAAVGPSFHHGMPKILMGRRHQQGVIS